MARGYKICVADGPVRPWFRPWPGAPLFFAVATKMTDEALDSMGFGRRRLEWLKENLPA